MEVLVAFSFGNRVNALGHLIPNRSTIGVIDSVEKYMLWKVRTGDVRPRLVVQSDMVDEFKRRGITPDRVVSRSRHLHRHVDTMDVAIEAKRYVEEQLNGKVVCVPFAHRDHSLRCRSCLRRVGLSTVGRYYFKSFRTEVYDPDSLQWWVRGRRLFMFREFLALPYYFCTKQLF